MYLSDGADFQLCYEDRIRIGPSRVYRIDIEGGRKEYIMANFSGKGNATQRDMLATVLARNEKGVFLDVQLDQSQGPTTKKAVEADVKDGKLQSNAHLVNERVAKDGKEFVGHGMWYSNDQFNAMLGDGAMHKDPKTGKEFFGFKGNIGYSAPDKEGKTQPMVRCPKGIPEGATPEQVEKINKYNEANPLGPSSHEITDKTLSDHMRRTSYAHKLISEQRAAAKQADGPEVQQQAEAQVEMG